MNIADKEEYWWSLTLRDKKNLTSSLSYMISVLAMTDKLNVVEKWKNKHILIHALSAVNDKELKRKRRNLEGRERELSRLTFYRSFDDLYLDI